MRAVVWRVTVYEPPRSFTWAARLAPGARLEAGHVVEPEGDGCRVTVPRIIRPVRRPTLAHVVARVSPEHGAGDRRLEEILREALLSLLASIRALPTSPPRSPCLRGLVANQPSTIRLVEAGWSQGAGGCWAVSLNTGFAETATPKMRRRAKIVAIPM